MRKILLLTNNVAPYRNPLFSRLNRKFAEMGWEFQVLFMREREAVRSWDVRFHEMDYSFEILKGIHISPAKAREIHFNPSLWVKLVRFKPDVLIIGGYNTVSSWIALLYGKLFGKKLVMWSGSIPTSSTYNQPLVKKLKKLFLRSCDAFVTYGTKAREFLVNFGVHAENVFIGCNVGDVDFYRKWREFPSRKQNLAKAELVFAGHLVKRKGIFNLLEALGRVGTDSWHLTILGSGPEQKNLEELCRENGLTGRVTFAGFKQKEELSEYYLKADIFVLTSLSDPFSIVMSEALASGLFVIASKYDGASYDIVQHGVNGYITDPNDIGDLAGCLEKSIRGVAQLPPKRLISDSIAPCLDRYAQQFVNAALH